MEIGAYKTMDRKKYLKKGYRIKIEIDSKKAVLEEMRSTLDGLQAVKLTEKLQGGQLPSDESIANRIAKVVEEEEKLAVLYDFVASLSTEIDKVEDTLERAILRYRYITCLTWEQIAERMGYSMAQIYRIHNRAFKNFNKINESK